MHEKMSYFKNDIFIYIKSGQGERPWIPSQALRMKKEESRHASVLLPLNMASLSPPDSLSPYSVLLPLLLIQWAAIKAFRT